MVKLNVRLEVVLLVNRESQTTKVTLAYLEKKRSENVNIWVYV